MNLKAAALLVLMIFFLSAATTAAIISLKIPNTSQRSSPENMTLDKDFKPNGDPIPGPWPPGTY